MNYQKYFDTQKTKAEKTVPAPKFAENPKRGKAIASVSVGGDRRDGLVYVYNEKIELAVNVALATRRPMLLRGPSGSGKSSLARNIARRLGWWYYEQVITSRTQARDLQWNFDTLRRLSDAQARQLKRVTNSYIEPGVLWWAFDPVDAKRRGHNSAQGAVISAKDPGSAPDKGKPVASGKGGAVVLLDEIDKADPDVPNNLLVPLGSLQFKVVETGITVEVRATRPLLMLITTNDERVLPNAFMRRCVVLELDPPDEALLIEIAKQHFGKDANKIYDTIAKRVLALAPNSGGATLRGGASGPVAASSAEYLDTVRACIELGVDPETNDDAWQAILNATLMKKANL
jgi:MoxR-like ATPase